MKGRYAIAVVMGLLIGILAVLLDRWVSEAGWGLRAAALVITGSVLCVAQHGLARWRR
jgi:O-antigen/teichoic acid export membrane protein